MGQTRQCPGNGCLRENHWQSNARIEYWHLSYKQNSCREQLLGDYRALIQYKRWRLKPQSHMPCTLFATELWPKAAAISTTNMWKALQWCHNECDSISNPSCLDCLLDCSGTDQRKHHCPKLLAFVRGIHQWPVNSPHKGPVTQKRFLFDVGSMASSWNWQICTFL